MEGGGGGSISCPFLLNLPTEHFLHPFSGFFYPRISQIPGFTNESPKAGELRTPKHPTLGTPLRKLHLIQTVSTYAS